MQAHMYIMHELDPEATDPVWHMDRTSLWTVSIPMISSVGDGIATQGASIGNFEFSMFSLIPAFALAICVVIAGGFSIDFDLSFR